MRVHYLLSFLLIVLSMSSVLAAPLLTIQEIDKGSIVVKELDNPAAFDLEIINQGPSEEYKIFSFISVSFNPKGMFLIPTGRSTISVLAYPSEDLRDREGFLTFEYNLRGDESGLYTDTMTIRVIELEDSLEITPQQINRDDTSASVVIRNTQNTRLENLNVIISSEFYSIEKIISLEPFESLTLTAPLDRTTMASLRAGSYVVDTQIRTKSSVVPISGVVQYVAEESIATYKTTEGYLVRKTSITKTNEGNTILDVPVEIRKDLVSRLFTVFSKDPDERERSGLGATYRWSQELAPGQTYTIGSTTNYTFPFIMLLLLILIAVFIRIHSLTAVVVNKRVSFVKTKGNHFALKVSVHVTARKHVDNVTLIDRLPGVMKLYDKFGRTPDKIEEHNRRVFWNLGSLNSGEERVISYVIYTNVKIVGRFELPPATAVFEVDDVSREAISNKAFFMSEGTPRVE